MSEGGNGSKKQEAGQEAEAGWRGNAKKGVISGRAPVSVAPTGDSGA